MTEFNVINKQAFTVLGFGRTVSYGAGANKFAQIIEQKSGLWAAVAADGRLQQLQALSSDGYLVAVNEAVNNEMWYYTGAISDAAVPAGARAIDFPAGQYLVVAGTGATPGALFGQLEGAMFGEVLPNNTEYAYVGGPNIAVQTGVDGDQVVGEMWLPVVAK